MDSVNVSFSLMQAYIGRNKTHQSDFLLAVKTVLLNVMLVYVIIGGLANVRVLRLLLRRKLYQSSRHCKLLLNLVIADSFVCFVTLPAFMAENLSISWPLGLHACLLYRVTNVYGYYASSLVLIIISSDRFCAVAHPFTYRLMDYKFNVALKLVWFASLLLSLPQLVFYQLVPAVGDEGTVICLAPAIFATRWDFKVYLMVMISFMYWIPALVIISCYTTIYLKYRRNHKKMANVKISRQITSAGLWNSDLNNKTVAGTGDEISQRIMRQTVLLVSVFMICWLPWAMLFIWYVSDDVSAIRVVEKVIPLASLIGTLNCVINPFIYGRFVTENASAASEASAAAAAGVSSSRSHAMISMTPEHQVNKSSCQSIHRI